MAEGLFVDVVAVGLADGEAFGAASSGIDRFLEPAAGAAKAL